MLKFLTFPQSFGKQCFAVVDVLYSKVPSERSNVSERSKKRTYPHDLSDGQEKIENHSLDFVEKSIVFQI